MNLAENLRNSGHIHHGTDARVKMAV